MDGASLAALVLVLTVGLASALRLRESGFWLAVRNPTALALVIANLIVVATYRATGEAPLQLSIIADYLVLVVIFIKSHEECEPSPGALGWAKDCWLGLSWWDKAVVWLFLPSWTTYAITMPPVWAYWIAWTAGVLQLFAVGGEALEQWRRGRAQTKPDNPTDISMRRQGMAVSEC